MKIRWGVLGTAKIALTKVIPAMQLGQLCQVEAIASRQRGKAETVARELGIPRVHGSYDDLLADPEIDAVYIPLPNHLHVPMSIRAAEAGKHVLCEKPIGLTAAEARQLLRARDQTGVKIGEAFMVRSHPQWLRTRELIRGGAIGEVRSIVGFFSYFNADPANIRNIPEFGGGALMDIGCYPIHCSRYATGEEPLRVLGKLERDPVMKTDRLTSATLDFPGCQCIFTCSTQLTPHQRMQFFGTKGRIEIEIPFNAPPDRPTRILINDAVEEFSICNQYTLQGDDFSRAILENSDPAVPLEDSALNMAVIEAIFRSGETGRWEAP